MISKFFHVPFVVDCIVVDVVVVVVVVVVGAVVSVVVRSSRKEVEAVV